MWGAWTRRVAPTYQCQASVRFIRRREEECCSLVNISARPNLTAVSADDCAGLGESCIRDSDNSHCAAVDGCIRRDIIDRSPNCVAPKEQIWYVAVRFMLALNDRPRAVRVNSEARSVLSLF